MITLTNVTKAYKNNQVSVLNGIQLSIQSTDRVAITGPSGSGKSTLLRLIAGIEPQQMAVFGYLIVICMNAMMMNVQLFDEIRSVLYFNHFDYFHH